MTRSIVATLAAVTLAAPAAFADDRLDEKNRPMQGAETEPRANDKVARINAAWDRIKRERGRPLAWLRPRRSG